MTIDQYIKEIKSCLRLLIERYKYNLSFQGIRPMVKIGKCKRNVLIWNRDQIM